MRVKKKFLRSYPQRFGKAICDLMPKLKTEGLGRPVLPCGEAEPAYVLLMNAPWSDWEEAHMSRVIRYLYTNKHLCLPPEWKQVFPLRV